MRKKLLKRFKKECRKMHGNVRKLEVAEASENSLISAKIICQEHAQAVFEGLPEDHIGATQLAPI